MSNPYLSLWDSDKSMNDIALEWAKNATLFVPTLEELAKRHMAHSIYLLRKARELNELGSVIDARSAFKDALIHRDMARKCLDEHHTVVLRSR